MAEIFGWIEHTPIGLWVREAPTIWAFPFVLLLHTVGLGAVAGTSVLLNVSALHSPARWRAANFEPWFRFAWAGFAVNLVSGVLLLAAYTAKALTNPVFYVKMICVVAAMYQLQWLRNHDAAGHVSTNAIPESDNVETGDIRPGVPAAALRNSAFMAFALWLIAVVTGRFLAYTYRYLMAADMSFGM